MSLFDEMLEAWRYTREGVIAEIENLPESVLKSAPSQLPRSGIELANHIVESGRLMAGELSRADGDFTRKPYTDLIAEHSRKGDVANTRDEAVSILRRSLAEGEGTLRAAGLERLLEPIRQFNGIPATRLAWMHHGISHEEYHRGQIAIYARLGGEKPALTKLIEGSA